jgi:hypothetical protein
VIDGGQTRALLGLRTTGEGAFRFLNGANLTTWCEMKSNLAVAVRSDDELTEAAYNRLVSQLHTFGNVLGISQKMALHSVICGFTALATGERHGRYAYALPCGTGKTEAVIAWITEASQLDRAYSVMVCATKVEELCEIKRRLLANGVAEADVGLMHSYEYPRKASLPATDDNDNRRYLLVTHQRVKGTQRAETYSTYRGLPRELVIWDESLLVSHHTAIEQVDLKQSIDWVAAELERKNPPENLKAAVAYLQYGYAEVMADYERQKRSKKAAPIPVNLSDRRSAEELSRMLSAIPNRDAAKYAKQFLEISQEQLRAVYASGGGGYIQYDIVVPPEFKNIAVLDASYIIRKLGRLDPSIKIDPAYAKIERRGDIKRYDQVAIFQLRHASGRGATERSFAQRRAEDRKVSQEVLHVLNWVPDDEGVILFTFKQNTLRDVNIVQVLKDDMLAAGLDPDAKLANGKPKYVFLTWGQETATSAYKHCANVLFAGVLHRDLHDLRGAIAGQSDNLLVDINDSDLLSVRTSEICYRLHQAVNRSAMRDTVNGQAPHTDVWLIHPSRDIRPTLDKVMPGVSWVDWEGKYLPTKTDQTEKEADALVTFLSRLEITTKRIAIRTVKKAIGSKLSNQPFQTARADALARLGSWKVEGSSFVRA